MRVIVVGAGQVGCSIAADLCEGHEVVVIERDPEHVDSLTYALDVLIIEGDGTSLDTLREAGVAEADMVIASTDDDETNIVACATVSTASDAFTIARVKRTTYLDTWRQAGAAFGVDFMICTEILAAETVVRIIGLPAAQDVDIFAEGQVLMAQFAVPERSPVAGHTVREADRFEELTFAAILREGGVIVPDGETVIEAADELIVIGTPESTRAFAGEVAPGQNGGRDIVIIGGSAVAIQIARLLEERGLHPRLIERDPERAREVAETLPGTTVMESDATDQEFLNREHVGDADVVIATLDSDEKNLLASLLASRLGVPRTVALVETPEYADLFEAVGVGAAISPRNAIAEEIIRFTREEGTENIAIIDDDRAEVLEIGIGPDSVLAGRPIRESITDLPDGTVIGAITRNGEFVTPRGDTVVGTGDHVVLFARMDAIDAVSAQV